MVLISLCYRSIESKSQVIKGSFLEALRWNSDYATAYANDPADVKSTYTNIRVRDEDPWINAEAVKEWEGQTKAYS